MQTSQEKGKVTILGGGCFWCTEAIFKSLKGVTSVTSGYCGGSGEKPTYEMVSTGSTGFVECVKIAYDPSVISFSDLLTVFFNTHDPTTLNQQGADIGTQYASVIFYSNEEEKKIASDFIQELTAAKAYDKPIVTVLKPCTAFYEAEDYHKNFYENHKDSNYCALVIAPKLEKLQKRFKELLADSSGN